MAENALNIELSALEIDSLITTGIGAKFYGTLEEPIIHILYEAAKSKIGGKSPSLYAAQRLIQEVKPKDIVLFLTGWTIRNWMEGETDGPPGCAALARALCVGLEAVPVVVTEDRLVEMVAGAFRGAGLHRYSLEEARRVPNRFAVIGIPTDRSSHEGEALARNLLNEIAPSAVIAVEKAGPNEKGICHSARGEDITALNIRADVLINEARKKGILTISCGDLGNEIGMGLIEDTVRRVVPYGERCNCPCESGLTCNIPTDIVIPAFVSNWGAYGIEACLALLLNQVEVMHDGVIEDFIYTECLRNNAICSPMGLSSFSQETVDQLPGKVNRYVVELLNYMVSCRLFISKSKDKFSKDISKTSAALK